MSNAEQQISESLALLGNSLLRHVVPLFSIPPGKRPSLVGTALLVSHAQRSYLVSARHVIERVRDPGSLYHYVERRQLARLFGHILHTAPEPGAIAPERFDLAVVRLLQEAAPPYPSLGKSALPSRFLAASTLPRSNKEYLVTGFPKSKSRANPVTKRLLSEPSAFRVESASVDAYQSMQLS